MSEEPNDPRDDGDESDSVDDATVDAGDESDVSSGHDSGTPEDDQKPPSFDEIPDHLKSDTAPTSTDETTEQDDEPDFADSEGAESASTTEVTKSFDDDEPTPEMGSEDGVEPDPSVDSDQDLSEDALRDSLSSTSQFGFGDVELSRRSFLLGASGATVGLFGGGFLSGSLYEEARLSYKRRKLKQEYQQMEQELAEQREQLQREYTPPTKNDKVVHTVDEKVTVPLRNFQSFSLKFETETLLTYEVKADDHIDIMVMQADEFADYRSKKEFIIRDRYSEMDTTVTSVSEVIPPGWYFLVLDHSEAGVAKPDLKTDGDVSARVSLKAYQQSDKPDKPANNSSS